MTIKQINVEIAIEMGKYKDACRKSRIAEGWDRELYQHEMDKCICRIKQLLEKKRKIVEG